LLDLKQDGLVPCKHSNAVVYFCQVIEELSFFSVLEGRPKQFFGIK
jgi:hypothetical protein